MLTGVLKNQLHINKNSSTRKCLLRFVLNIFTFTLFHYGPHPKDGEGNSFSLFVCPHWGGVPWPGSDGRYPSQVQMGGIPARSKWVNPGQGWGTPHPEVGYPPGQGWVPPTRDGISPPPQEYLIRDGWYASCVHAGGLSCFLKRFTENLWQVSFAT